MSQTFLQQLSSRASRFAKLFANRFDQSPIDSVESLTHFLQTRSAYIAQTSLFGYLKTRMGTRFPEFFQDKVFSATIQASAARIFTSCLSDLTVFSLVESGVSERMRPEQAVSLARYCYRVALEQGLSDIDGEELSSEALAEFDRRAAETSWTLEGPSEQLFSGSERDLVRHAPVVDQFKELDREIVSNSIRFRWRDVRDQLRKRLDGEALCRDWNEREGQAAEAGS